MSPSMTVALPAIRGGSLPEELHNGNRLMVLATGLHFNNVYFYFFLHIHETLRAT